MSSSSTETYVDVTMPQMGVSVAEGTVVGLLGTGLVGTADAAQTTVTGTVKSALGANVVGAKVSIKVGGGAATVGHRGRWRRGGTVLRIRRRAGLPGWSEFGGPGPGRQRRRSTRRWTAP